MVNQYRKYILLGMLLLGPSLVWAGIYKWTDADGNVHFSDKPVNDKAQQVELKATVNSYAPVSTPKFEYKPREKRNKQSKAGKPAKLKPGQVVMYSTTWCGYCKKAKAYFRKKGISFSEYDIEKSARAKQEYQALGGSGVPLILIGKKQGNKKMSGFSEATFESYYQQ